MSRNLVGIQALLALARFSEELATACSDQAMTSQFRALARRCNDVVLATAGLRNGAPQNSRSLGETSGQTLH